MYFFKEDLGVYRNIDAEDGMSQEEIFVAVLKEGKSRELKNIKVSWLKDKYIVVAKSVCANIMPITHDRELNYERLRLMYKIRVGC